MEWRKFCVCARPPACYRGGVVSIGGFVMIDRRSAIRLAVRLVLAGLPAAWLAVSPAQAQDFQKFVPFLVDLPGWTGAKADGMAMQVPGAAMITATREYKRGGDTLSVQIISGAAAQGVASGAQSGMKLETAEMHMSTATVDGLSVMRTFQVSDKSGAVIVVLAPNAILNVGFKGVAEDEALALAKRFDWKAIQAALPK